MKCLVLLAHALASPRVCSLPRQGHGVLQYRANPRQAAATSRISGANSGQGPVAVRISRLSCREVGEVQILP
jgi:hypothetical protein